ncbi:transporter substrate-binding domain-containing protein [Paraglaciecola sp.]|uniref:substrate-binding periplasmic protein n=1 Tax=Paraglaciecola sp. TaxID=1920173 RepID=UPI0030F429B8
MLLLLCAGQVNAEHPDLWVLTNLEPPFSQQNERGQFEGLVIDLANGILQEANIEQQILAAPWERILKEATSKANVMIFALARTPEREEQFHWITPLTSAIVGVFSMQTPDKSISQLSELDLTASIGVLDGDYRQKLLQQVGASNIVILNSWAQGAEMLLNGDIRNLFMSSIGIQVNCKTLLQDCSHIKRILTYQQITTYVALSAGTDTATISTLMQAAERYKRSAAFLQTTQEWLSNYKQKNGLDLHLDNGVINLWAAN